VLEEVTGEMKERSGEEDGSASVAAAENDLWDWRMVQSVQTRRCVCLVDPVLHFHQLNYSPQGGRCKNIRISKAAALLPLLLAVMMSPINQSITPSPFSFQLACALPSPSPSPKLRVQELFRLPNNA
jgi:hypothetical protein